MVRASVPNIDLDEVFTTKEEIARIVQDELSKAFAGFGYEILQALVTDIDPDPRVKAAMNEVGWGTCRTGWLADCVSCHAGSPACQPPSATQFS